MVNSAILKFVVSLALVMTFLVFAPLCVGDSGVSDVSSSDTECVEPVRITLSDHEVVLEEGKSPGEFHSSEPIVVTVGSFLPRWRLFCAAEAAIGQEGAKIPPKEVFVILSKLPKNPKKHFVSPPVCLDNPVLIADGGMTRGRMVDVNALTIMVKFDPIKPPGEYVGRMRLMLEIEKEGKLIAGPEFRYRFRHRGYATIALDPEGMQFGMLEQGINGAENVPWVTIETNRCDLEINVVMSELLRDDKRANIPTSVMCLAWGESPTQARQNALAVDFGENSFVWYCETGKHTIYLFSRLKIDLGIRPGDYTGMINVMSSIPAP